MIQSRYSQRDNLINKANIHKSRALRTISHKIYKKLRNVQKSQKCREVSEMYKISEMCRSVRNVQKSQKVQKSYKCTKVSEMYSLSNVQKSQKCI